MYTTMGGETCANVTRSGCYAETGGAAMIELARTTPSSRTRTHHRTRTHDAYVA
jgi:hypothetical protein